MRQNRQDVLDGNLVLPTNGSSKLMAVSVTASLMLSFQPSLMMSERTSLIEARRLYVVSWWFSVHRCRCCQVTSSLVPNLLLSNSRTTSSTTTSPNLINYLAALGIDQSQIKVVNGCPRRRSSKTLEDIHRVHRCPIRRQSDGVKLVLEILPEAVDFKQLTTRNRTRRQQAKENRSHREHGFYYRQDCYQQRSRSSFALEQYVATTESSNQASQSATTAPTIWPL